MLFRFGFPLKTKRGKKISKSSVCLLLVVVFYFSLLQAYKAITGRYTDKKELLRLPPYVLSQRCIRDLDIQMDWGGFRVTARPVEEFLEDGHTRTDRFVWFGEKREDFF